MTGLLNKLKNAQTRKELTPDVANPADSNVYSDDEDDERYFVAVSSENLKVTNSPSSQIKNMLVEVSKTILYVICLPILFICDLINTVIQWAFSFIAIFGTSNNWKHRTIEWLQHKQYQFPAFQSQKRQGWLKLTLILLIAFFLISLLLYIWGNNADAYIFQDLWASFKIKTTSAWSISCSVATWIAHCVVGMTQFCLHYLGNVFSSGHFLTHQDQTSNVYQTSEELKFQLETVLESLLADEKFAIRVKQEAQKFDEARLEGITKAIREHENILTNLINEHKTAADNQQKEIADDFKISKIDTEEKIVQLYDVRLPFITNQINAIELRIKNEENEDNQRFAILQNGVQDMHEQLKLLKKQQANNSHTIKYRDSDLQSKLDDLELRLNNLISAHVQLSQTISDCSKSKTVNSEGSMNEDNLLEERIGRILNDIFDENIATQDTDPDSNLSKAREYISKLKSTNIINRDTVSEDQLQVQLEAATRTLKQDLLNDVQIELSKSFATGGNTDKYLQESIETKLNDLLKKHQTSNINVENNVEMDNVPFSKEDVSRIIKTELVTYDADKTGKFDFALESAGGTIANTRCTQTYDVATAVYSVWGIPIWWESVNGPRAILQPGANPGQCWAVKGDGSGVGAPPISVVIRLSDVVEVHSVTLEHIPETLSPDGNIRSAPKQFSVFGLNDLNEPNPVLLGNFTYVTGNRPVQTFQLLSSDENTDQGILNKGPFALIELKVHSNYGNPTYTCIYRFRVHGDLTPEANSNLR